MLRIGHSKKAFSLMYTKPTVPVDHLHYTDKMISSQRLAESVLRDCWRISSKKILLVDSMQQGYAEIGFLLCMGWIDKKWKIKIVTHAHWHMVLLNKRKATHEINA